jgi:hypothetical protein
LITSLITASSSTRRRDFLNMGFPQGKNKLMLNYV